MTHAHASVVQLAKMLKNLQGWLEKGAEHAKKKSYDPSVLLQARLAPDMLPLVRQVQSSCDGAKVLAARLAGREPPKHPDTEQTFDELRARVQLVLDYLATFKAEDFKGAAERIIPLPFIPGKGLTGVDYLNEMNLPNTYFHLTIAYAILRHSGVDLGKMDYIGPINLKDV